MIIMPPDRASYYLKNVVYTEYASLNNGENNKYRVIYYMKTK